ncbi:hypothetical protein EJ05DRAFT_435194 [Pseudovirgaria hyperparasitica]|uniref:F-box domain-containing protein n=1 Tax=Pseudovirgaria hyperparasitica TaxID=470096 RepID=A0A6A6WDG8_9PEZI|nr:uncharacterized protein EJ05DRAFT_435194 [Pseudovirgaria hyperparasitica]KAF2760753.1 hypothetical protein EJ05DRAFT_435194 [Pseudovirgaria hyperparasitica]
MPPSEDQRPKGSISRLLKGKEKEWNEVAEKRGPLTLLDLPVDILKEIVHQLPHTNDLTSLALCHSALHSLAIPYIYSRFDIVWPDASTSNEPRVGVDALTYGLSTLVMAKPMFREDSRPSKPKTALPKGYQQYALPPIRRGNYYAKYTKKFSLGNGPTDWVQEYLITKEPGKMLGTQVALAVARMENLETFVWDMPTGVLRDVWLSLSSLADRNDPESCRLERIWIRWHNNSDIDSHTSAPSPPIPLAHVMPAPHAPHTSGANVTSAPVAVSAHAIQTNSAIDRVERPTFSVLPALKSLSVLDIDELPYLDEMSILIARSQHKLRELRVGIARHSQQRDWVNAWEGDGLQQVDYNWKWTSTTPRIQDKRLGGVLGILVGRVYNMRRNAYDAKPPISVEAAGDLFPASTKTETPTMDSTTPVTSPVEHSPTAQSDESLDEPSDTPEDPVTSALGLKHDTPTGEQNVHSRSSSASAFKGTEALEMLCDVAQLNRAEIRDQAYGPALKDRLQLHTLELERVPISVPILLKAFDWSMLTTLTLLNCHGHDALWKFLRRSFSPRYSGHSASKAVSNPPRPTSYDYRLNLRKIHTNTVSAPLISFLKETLAPNSLEVLFLQEHRSYNSNVTVDAIYKGPIKRHRESLKKVMIDSSDKCVDGHATGPARWRRWMVNREFLGFITSGRMRNLRELAITMDFRDWHYFLQRLPQIPHLRSLYIPVLAEHGHGHNIDPKVFAMQVIDIVHLKPEVELCYMGIMNKCFEILENKPSGNDSHSDANPQHSSSNATGIGYNAVGQAPMNSDDEGDDTEDDDDDDDDDGMNGELDETESEPSDDGRTDTDGEDSYMHDDDRRGPKVRLREILFYDDKVAIFKARHGKL